MFTRRNILIGVGVIILVIMVAILSTIFSQTSKGPELLSTDIVDTNQDIIVNNNDIYYITSNGFIRKISGNVTSPLGSVNTNFSPQLSDNAEHISFIDPDTRELTVQITQQQGSASTPLIRVGGVAFTSWQDSNNLVYVQFQNINNKYDKFYDPEDSQPNIIGNLFSVDLKNNKTTLVSPINLQDILLANPNYIIYSYRESANDYSIKKLDINSKQTTSITNKAISGYKKINNNNIIISSGLDNYPFLIQNGNLIELKTSTKANLITALNISEFKNAYSVVPKKDNYVLEKISTNSGSASLERNLEEIITNPISIVASPERFVIFTQDGVYTIPYKGVSE